MKNGVVAGAILVVLVLVNGVFLLWTSPDLDSGSALARADAWHTPVLSEAFVVDLDSMVATGFWGDVAETGESASDGGKGLAEAESAVLRKRVKTIVRNADGWQVLIEGDGEYLRLGAGEQIPGTQWWLVGVYPDRLELSQRAVSAVDPGSAEEREAKPENTRVLRLFSSNVLETSAD